MDLGSNPSECQIFNLFRCVLSSLLLLRIVGRSNFDKGLHNLIPLIKKRLKIIIKNEVAMLQNGINRGQLKKEHYIYIYIWSIILKVITPSNEYILCLFMTFRS